MPNAPSTASKSITVLSVSLTLSVNKRWAKVGDTVRFSGKLTRDGEGWGGETVYIKLNYGGLPTIASTTTASDGSFSVDWKVPWKVYDHEWKTYHKLPCGDWGFYAWHAGTNTSSSTVKLAVAYPTRISISAPDRVTVNQSFVVKGKLEYCDEDTWKALAGKYVYVNYDNKQLGSAKTDTYGEYEVVGSISSPGTYKLTAIFPGEGIPQQAGLRISAGSMGAGLAVMLLALLA